jgi:DNA (cytosine-5)-methyltransferase 1
VNDRFVLDVYCCEGGATRGYQIGTGLRVLGIDSAPQPRYCGDGFLQYDAIQALEVLRDGGALPFRMKDGSTLYVTAQDIVFVHTSPPCQAANPLTTGTNAGLYYHPQLIPEARDLLVQLGIPFVIENTAGAPIRKDLTLNGDMFGLDVWRPRWFEFGNGFSVPQPPGPRKPSRGRVRGWRHGEYFDGPYVAVYGKGGGKASVAEAQRAMGIDWTDNWLSLTEAIPPAYTEYIGGFVA